MIKKLPLKFILLKLIAICAPRMRILDLKNKVEQQLAFIKYRSTPIKSEEIRDIVVINGQPFYRSTGNNSNLPNVWLPFICIRGQVDYIKKEKITPLLEQGKLTNQFINALIGPNYVDNYIIKFSTIFENSYKSLFNQWMLTNDSSRFKKSPIDNLLIGCVNLECLAISYSLGGGIWEDENYNSLIINKFFKEQIPGKIYLQETAVFDTQDPKKVNEWLIQSGASYASQVFQFDEKSRSKTSSNFLPEVELVVSEQEKEITSKKEIKNEIQPGFLLFICRFLDEISLLAFFIPIVGQLYLGARLANNFEPLTKGKYSFFSCCSAHQFNDESEESHFDWNIAPFTEASKDSAP